IRIAPPTRGSASQTGFVNPFGPHHSARCLASIHARNTNSGDAAIRLVRLTSSSPASSTLLFPMQSSLRLYLAQIILQLIEATIPSTNVPIAVFVGYEESLVEVHRRLPVMLLERHRNHRLMTAKPGALVPLKRIDQPLRRNHLPGFAALPQIKLPQHAVACIESIAVQTKPPLPARPRVVLYIRRHKLTWSSPLLHMFRIGPHLPHQFARRIEHPSNMQLMLSYRCKRHRRCTHFIPPYCSPRSERIHAPRASPASVFRPQLSRTPAHPDRAPPPAQIPSASSAALCHPHPQRSPSSQTASQTTSDRPTPSTSSCAAHRTPAASLEMHESPPYPRRIHLLSVWKHCLPQDFRESKTGPTDSQSTEG